MSENRTVNVGIRGDAKGLINASKQGERGLAVIGGTARKVGRDLDGMSSIGERGLVRVGAAARATSRDTEVLVNRIDRASRAAAHLGRTSEGMRKTLAWGSDKIVNQYTMLAGGLGAAAIGMQSANLDQTLTRIRLAAGATKDQAADLRKELFRLAKETGAPVDDLAAGFGNLIQSGQSWDAARQQIGATSKAMAVTGTDARILTNALSVAGEAFQFDLSKPGKALEILDKMTQAGYLGNAELENLSDIFARVGVNSKSAGMGFEQTLAFLETLSFTERNPERLATLADSTLRLFNNLNYQKAAQKATGVKFFDRDGARRDAVVILADLQAQYKKLNTDQQRANWIQKAFGKTDLDTIKGIRVLMDGQALERGIGFASQISSGVGILNRQLPEALDNAKSQVDRLKASLREASESFAGPINSVIKVASKWAANHQTATKVMAWGGMATLLGAVGVTGYVKGARIWKELQELRGAGVGGLGSSRKGGGLGGAVASLGATPVFVVNMPGGSFGGGMAKGIPYSSGGFGDGLREVQTATRGARVSRALGRYGVPALGAAMILADQGSSPDAWGEIAGMTLGAEAGAKLGLFFAGPFGALLGSAIGGVLGTTVYPWLKQNVAEFDARKKLEDAADPLGDKRRSAFLGARDASAARVDERAMRANASAGPVPAAASFANEFKIMVNVDKDGRSSSTVTGPGATSVSVDSSLKPRWLGE